MRMPGHPVISFSGLDTCLSSLKQCQSYIITGMDITTNVALDLVQNHNDMEEVNEMENVMLECAAMSREVNHYVKAVEETVNQIKKEKPEMIPDLKLVVEEKFKALESLNNDHDLQRNEKFVLFKDQLRKMKAQFSVQSDPEQIPDLEQVDEDIAVTQSQINFICPITQEEMRKPVKNKICGHTYEKDAILELIRTKEQRKKKACCPTVGCNNRQVKKSDLVPDEVLKRTIDSQSKHSQSTQ
ncbi:E3 SUMO-protein ligase NSE2 [Sceloporus undulatus]|uniref:E3 SUMO-protein ligase NSE2 n=1 Tax=Sceloporus undulatus TaxID=8520 RepID=UPI001C4B2C61|nr:E3 SUMO-protein ligase NSE2 [Sceloporus undulatus]XP_042321741.1 E3 SUMO-protein ligase NSE2 [Sceloporus undulatus]XP_042321742.1 E3 SUMO-protein ligase NSE2 [Sceloporus undulatus]